MGWRAFNKALDDAIPQKNDSAGDIIGKALTSDLAIALMQAGVQFGKQPGHHKHCLGVHCTAHQVFFPRELFCLVQRFYRVKPWRLLFCSKCLDALHALRTVDRVITYDLKGD